MAGFLQGLGNIANRVADASANIIEKDLRFTDPLAYNEMMQSRQLLGQRGQELEGRQALRSAQLVQIQRQQQQADLARQREAEQRAALGNIFRTPNFNPDAQGPVQPGMLGRISPSQMGDLVESGVGLNELGRIQEMLTPQEPNLPQGVNIPSGYQPKFTNGQFTGVERIPGLEMAQGLPQGVDLPEGFMPKFENGQFVGAQPIPGLERQTGTMQGNIPLGLPRDIPDPLQGFKDQEKAQIELLKQSEDVIKKLEEPLDAELSTVERLERFEQLLSVQDTGPGQIPSPFGYMDAELREMKAIQSEIAPRMRAPGSGSSSDADVAMFKEATVDPLKPKQTNLNIITGRKAAAQNKIDRAQFFREFQAAYGHTKGAEKEWNDYLEKNPIFDHKAPKSQFVINPSRLDYKSYFSAKNIKNAYKDGKITIEQARAMLYQYGFRRY